MKEFEVIIVALKKRLQTLEAAANEARASLHLAEARLFEIRETLEIAEEQEREAKSRSGTNAKIGGAK